eukprot:COSAG05_NODE_19830_length_287_cov_0.813830_1_plen_36_part_10
MEPTHSASRAVDLGVQPTPQSGLTPHAARGIQPVYE